MSLIEQMSQFRAVRRIAADAGIGLHQREHDGLTRQVSGQLIDKAINAPTESP
jgi:hypothetical protein